jgi:chaperone BCS1
MEEFRAKKQAKKSTVYIANVDTWGDWDYKNLPAKDMDSVFLPEGVKEDLVLDIEKFLSREKQFEIVGMPWHRGYVFYGEPGNGKSSIALALANHFEMDLFNLPLSSVREDKTMAKAIARLKKGSILLLEDIDIFSESISRESGHHGPTLAGLLNALDGVSTPHGLITIMTTNHFEKLDPALIRKGRMDYKLELKSPDYYQINGLFKRVYGEDLNMEIKNFKAMADVADIFKRNFDDIEAARMELKDDSGE